MMTHQLFPGKLEHRDTVKRIKQKQIKVLKFSGSLRQLQEHRPPVSMVTGCV